MKDKDDNSPNVSAENFGVWNDPELEARLVAMLMGELSPFEEAEMEHELEVSPELRLFRDRMIEVKGLIDEVNQGGNGEAGEAGEDASHADDEDWSLSSERRAALLENFAKELVERAELVEDLSTVAISTREIQWRNVFSIAACFLISLAAFMMMFVRKTVVFYNTEEVVTYSTASEDEMEELDRLESGKDGSYRYFSKQKEKKQGVSEKEMIEDEAGLLPDIESDDQVDAFASKPEITNEIRKKPSQPKSNTASVIAAKTTNSKSVTVPGIDPTDKDLSFNGASRLPVEFGESDDFGDGFGSRRGSGEGKKRSGSEIYAKRESREADEKDFAGDPFGENEEMEQAPVDQLKRDSIASSSVGSRADVTKGGIRKDLSLLFADQESTLKRQEEVRRGERNRGIVDAKSSPEKARERLGGLHAELEERKITKNQYKGGAANDDQKGLQSWLLSGADGNGLPPTTAEARRVTADLIDTKQAGDKELGYDWIIDPSAAQEKGRSSNTIGDSARVHPRGYRYDHGKQLEDKILTLSGVFSSDDLTKSKLSKEAERYAWYAEGEAKKANLTTAEKKAEFEHDLNGRRLSAVETYKKKRKIQEKVIPDFSKEISAAKQTHSTFSLNVSDVSFKLAKNILLEKGGMPEASKIRVEEFVNAFDYGDPGVSANEKVSCVVEQCAHPFYQQRNLMRIGMKTGAMGRSQPLRLTVLLDNSGSMEREDRAATVLKAVEALASQLGPQDEVTLMSFARGARLVAQKVKGDEAMKLAGLVRGIPSEGGTNLSRAIEQAYTIAQQSMQDGAMSRIVLITDGAANLGNADPEELSKSVEKMRQHGIAFDACGVGADGLDDDMLEALTRKGDGRYYFINRPEDADAGFAQKLAGALRPAAKNVKVQVVFNPERVGNYRLVGFEKHRLKKEDFRNDKVDAAEMAAEEAGNALYQVEARPDGAGGKGDVGTVFVRFRDMATGRMVERSWAIPYEPNIKNLSLSEPSMQLAAVAGMLGERLKLGEDAGIDLDQIKPALGKLRSYFYNDPEVQDLIRMCGKLTR